MNTTGLARCACHARVAQSVAILLALLAVACTKQQMYRPDNIEKGPGYTLRFVEFDDQGEPWAPAQAERVLETIERANQSPVTQVPGRSLPSTPTGVSVRSSRGA